MKMAQIMAQTKNLSIRAKKDRNLSVVADSGPERRLPAMPLEIEYSPVCKIEMGFERLKDDVVFRFRVSGTHGVEAPDIDAHITRETFLDVKTPGEALDFLSATGHFRTQDEAFPARHETLLWSDFQRWQELIGILMYKGQLPERGVFKDGKQIGIEFAVPERIRPIMGELSFAEERLLKNSPEGIAITPEPESRKPGARIKLVARMTVNSTLEAMLATVYLDSLSGVNYGLCALPDCNCLFVINSNHAREYCSNACAHKASVRRRRAAAKVKVKSPTTKSSTRKGRK